MNTWGSLHGNVSGTPIWPQRTKEKINEYTPENTSVSEYITANRAVIEAKRASTVKPAYLILGAAPGEYPSGRTFFDDPHYWLLSNQSGTGNTSRFLKIDWDKPGQLEYLASQLPDQFDVICFDYSTAKFFVDDVPEKTIQNNIRAIYTLLKKDGLFIAEMSTMLGGESKRKYYDNLIKNVGFSSQGIGFHTDLLGNRVISNIYGAHETLRDRDESVILGLYKKPSRGGKRRKTRKSKRQSRKTRANRRI